MKRKILGLLGRIFAVGLIVAVFSVAVMAQEKKVELSGSVGHTFSTGFDVDPVTLGNTFINNVGMNSGFSYNFHGEYLIEENIGFGFLFSRQKSKLTASGTRITGGSIVSGKVTIAEMPTYNYQFPLSYTFFASDARIRPFILGGIGWTQFSPGTSMVNVPGTNTPYDLDNKSKFAGTVGGGVKFFLSNSFGIKATARWTISSVNSQTEGMWCNFYYCVVDQNYKHSNQGEFSTGVFVRF